MTTHEAAKIRPIPEMKRVRSSTIESVGYEAQHRRLHIRFKNGQHYSYEDVPDHIHSNIHTVESVGKFVHQYVKGKYTHRKH